MRGPVLTALKSATEAQHASTETTLPTDWSRITRERYAAWLSKMAGFHLPMEEKLFAHDWAALGLPHANERKRTELLRADLAALGIDAAALPRCEKLPDVSGAARAMGALYVTEGSKLGGQVLTRQLPAGLPSAFLSAGGESTGARWVEFMRFAEEHPQWANEACAAAVETFSSLGEWLR